MPITLSDGPRADREPSTSTSLLEVRDLRVSFPKYDTRLEVVHGISFDVHPGETVAIVGESGSGKSVTALSAMGLLGTGRIESGSIRFEDTELVGLAERDYRAVRGRRMSMIFQDPLAALDPLFTVGFQLAECLRLGGLPAQQIRQRSIELLDSVGIADPERRLKAYPHELSGGQRQRVVVAMAISCSPRLIVADEPTTALDATVKGQILDLIQDLQRQSGAAMLIITHDMSVVARVADRVVVMYAGDIVEEGPVRQVLDTPRHAYTRALIDSVPHKAMDRDTPIPTFDAAKLLSTDDAASGAAASPVTTRRLEPRRTPSSPTTSTDVILKVDDLTKHYSAPRTSLFRAPERVDAVTSISFTLGRGRTLGLVGESGSGKSTTARLIMGLTQPTSGGVEFDGTDVLNADRPTRERLRMRMQMIFQDPRGSLDPRLRVRDVVGEGLVVHRLASGARLRSRVEELLEIVGLDPRDADKFAHQFSGGQAQRIAIARALATDPEVLVCDEAVSSLDVSIQAQILNLLKQLQRDYGLSYLFISHDLNVVRYMSDDVMVMYLGEAVEYGSCATVFDDPAHPYTRKLLATIDDDAHRATPTPEATPR